MHFINDDNYDIIMLVGEAVISLIIIKFVVEHYLFPMENLKVVMKFLFCTSNPRSFPLLAISTGVLFCLVVIGVITKSVYLWFSTRYKMFSPYDPFFLYFPKSCLRR